MSLFIVFCHYNLFKETIIQKETKSNYILYFITEYYLCIFYYIKSPVDPFLHSFNRFLLLWMRQTDNLSLVL